jgi:hypothetical protein
MATEARHVEQLARRERRGVRREHGEDRLHRVRHVVHEETELVVPIRIERRVAVQLAA